MKKKLHLMTAMVLVLSMLMTVAASAKELVTVDPEKDTGSITITVKYGDEKVEGREVTVYRVAAGKLQEHNLVFVLQDVLAPAEGETALELNGLTAEEVKAVTEALEEKIEGLTDEEKAAILAGAAETDAEGVAKFEEMPVGVYLVVYTGGSRYHFDPVLLYLPYTNEDGTAWEGDVAASPKVSYDKPDKPDKPDEPDVPDTPDTPDEPDDPGEEIPDDPTPTGGKDPGEELEDPEIPMGGLPQTGLLQWPVPVMTVAGLALIAAGLLSERKRKA